VADEREVVRARLDALERQRKFLDRGGTPPSAAAKSPATATATATAATARTAATSAAKSSPVRVSVGSDSASPAADAKASAFLASGRARTSPASCERRSSGYSDDFHADDDGILEELINR
jgi:hypothetical protein